MVIADEPTGNLDSKTADSVFQLFANLVKQGKTIVMVTHDNDLAKRVSRAVTIVDGEIIEEYLTRVFPALTEEQLVAATHRLNPVQVQPGALILQEGSAADNFYIVMKGQVDVVVRQPGGKELVVASLGKGKYFGEIELVSGGHNLATVRAAPDDVTEVATLDRETFNQLMAESAPTRTQFEAAAQKHVQENVAARKQGAAR